MRCRGNLLQVQPDGGWASLSHFLELVGRGCSLGDFMRGSGDFGRGGDVFEMIGGCGNEAE